MPGTEFPYAPEAVGQARRSLGGELRRLAVAPTAADDAVLILSELVSNALRHARPLEGGKIRVAWWMEDNRVLRIAVTDGGRSGPDPVAAAAEAAWYAGGIGDAAAVDGPLAEVVGLADEDGWADLETAAHHGHPDQPRLPAGAVLTAVALDEVDESAVDGRGLGIVGALADAWGVEPFVDGPDAARPADGAAEPVTDPWAPKTVWAEVRVHARHAAPPPPDKKRRGRRDPGGRPPAGRLRVVRTLLAALWPGGSHGTERTEPAAWVPRYLPVGRAVA